MSWFWKSNSQQANTSTDIQDSTPRILSNTNPDMTSTHKSKLPKDDTERDLAEFMPIFGDSSSQQESSTQPQSIRDSIREKLPSRHEAEIQASGIVSYPETMSCRTAFDDAFYCQSIGGQFINVYRFGTYRNCSENWSQFWFCMRTRGKPEERKRLEIQEFYKKKEAKQRAGPNSEDIWEQRDKKVDRAFDWDEDTVADQK